MRYLDKIENLFKKRIYSTEMRIIREASELIIEVEKTSKFTFSDTGELVIASISTHKPLNYSVLVNGSGDQEIEYYKIDTLISKYDNYMPNYVGSEVNDLSYYDSVLRELGTI